MTNAMYSSNPTVRRRQHAIEREVLAHMKRKARDGYAKSVPQNKRDVDMFLMSPAWHNALDRLKAKDLVRIGKFGYVVTSKGWRSR